MGRITNTLSAILVLCSLVAIRAGQDSGASRLTQIFTQPPEDGLFAVELGAHPEILVVELMRLGEYSLAPETLESLRPDFSATLHQAAVLLALYGMETESSERLDEVVASLSAASARMAEGTLTGADTQQLRLALDILQNYVLPLSAGGYLPHTAKAAGSFDLARFQQAYAFAYYDYAHARAETMQELMRHSRDPVILLHGNTQRILLGSMALLLAEPEAFTPELAAKIEELHGLAPVLLGWTRKPLQDEMASLIARYQRLTGGGKAEAVEMMAIPSGIPVIPLALNEKSQNTRETGAVIPF